MEIFEILYFLIFSIASFLIFGFLLTFLCRKYLPWSRQTINILIGAVAVGWIIVAALLCTSDFVAMIEKNTLSAGHVLSLLIIFGIMTALGSFMALGMRYGDQLTQT